MKTLTETKYNGIDANLVQYANAPKVVEKAERDKVALSKIKNLHLIKATRNRSAQAE